MSEILTRINESGQDSEILENHAAWINIKVDASYPMDALAYMHLLV